MPIRCVRQIIPRMDWKQATSEWRKLSAEEKARRRWQRIPRNVAQSMAFEGEPVSLALLEAEHARHPMPSATSKAAKTD